METTMMGLRRVWGLGSMPTSELRTKFRLGGDLWGTIPRLIWGWRSYSDALSGNLHVNPFLRPQNTYGSGFKELLGLGPTSSRCVADLPIQYLTSLRRGGSMKLYQGCIPLPFSLNTES